MEVVKMRKFSIKVNGTAYEVEVEELGGSVSSAPVQVSAPAPQAAAPAAQPAGEGEAVAAPMPGTILDIKVKAGDAVKAGQVLMILEAMKMENEIMAGCDGTVTSVMVSKGASVQTGDALCTIK
jgi:biotin carboxyl carrier protein